MAQPTARASMLIRCPVTAVFDAFVDPQQLTRFWLDRASGPLAPGATVTWDFMVPGATETVTVTAFDAPARIEFDWSDGNHVRLDFEDRGGVATRVAVALSGLPDGDAAVDATEGFSIVLCDLKTLLEGGRSANLVRDKAALIADASSASANVSSAIPP